MIGVHELHQKFMARVRVTDEDGCWEWIGQRTEHGYGRFRCNGLNLKAHRFAAAGFRIPQTSRFACHRCDNPPCVNPDHLFFARPADNTLDMIQKGRRVPSHPTSETARHTKLTRAQVEQIRQEYRPGVVSYTDLGERFGVTKQNIRCIVKGLTWK